MNRRDFVVGVFVMAGAVLAPVVTAQTSAPGTLSGTDRHFIMKAIQANRAEVEFGELAQQNSQREAVKQFGERMVKDHTAIDERLEKFAQSKGLSIPAGLDMKDQRTKVDLSSLKSEAFDRSYMSDMLKDHKKDIAVFEKAESTTDPGLRSFVTETLPTLREHLKLAHEVEDAVVHKTAHAN